MHSKLKTSVDNYTYSSLYIFSFFFFIPQQEKNLVFSDFLSSFLIQRKMFMCYFYSMQRSQGIMINCRTSLITINKITPSVKSKVYTINKITASVKSKVCILKMCTTQSRFNKSPKILNARLCFKSFCYSMIYISMPPSLLKV